MSSGAARPGAEHTREIEELVQAAERVLESGDVGSLPPHAVEVLMTLAVRAYTLQREAQAMDTPVPADALTATDAATACRGLLDAVDMELFELTLWGGAFATSDRPG